MSTSPLGLAPSSLPSSPGAPLVVSLECHGAGATLYLAGALGPREAMRAVRACERLPARVRTLRADLRNVVVAVEGSLETFALLLGEWRAERQVARASTCRGCRRRRSHVARAAGAAAAVRNGRVS